MNDQPDRIPAAQAEAAQALSDRASLLDPWAIRAAATLRLCDLVAEGADTTDELAGQAGADAGALGRLMRHLALLGLFRAAPDGRWEVTDLGAVLRDGHPYGLRATLDQADPFIGRLDRSAQGLLHSVLTGKPAWEALHGLSFWENMAQDPGFGKGYDAQMNRHSSRFGKALGRGYDWPGVRHLVDVGGGVGRTLAAILSAHPHLEGTLVDLPGPLAEAPALLQQAGVAERCRLAPQSFLDPLPAGGDVYLVANVIHNWDDADSGRILGRCAEAAGPDGRVLLVERIAPEGADESLQANVSHLDLYMLMTSGGRERSLDDLHALAAAAGLRHAETRVLEGCPWLSLLEYRVATAPARGRTTHAAATVSIS